MRMLPHAAPGAGHHGPASSGRRASGSSGGGQGRWLKRVTSEVGSENYQVPLDPYGDVIAVLVAAVDGRAAEGGRGLHALWTGAACCMYVFTIFGQAGLTTMFLATIAQGEALPYTRGRSKEMTRSLKTAVQTQMPLASSSATLQLCRRSDVCIVPSYFVILLVWFVHMTDKIAESLWLVVVTQRVPLKTESCEDSDSGSEGTKEDSSPRGRHGRGLIHEFSKNGTRFYQIHFLTPRLRWICLGIAMSKLVMTVWILWAGTVFLVFADEVQVLVLKCMVCSFFLHWGELIFSWLVSESKLQQLRHTSIRFHAIKSEDWSNWGSTLCRMLFALSTASFAWFFLFYTVREFRYACIRYKRAFPLE